MSRAPVVLVHVVGARPNFMKIAPLLRAASAVPGWQNVLVHTGQHYDDGMSTAFFRDLDIAAPDEFLGVGGGTHAEQTARALTAVERVLIERHAALTVVVGDVNSTLAATLAAAKLGVPVAHVEAGLRSGDRTMPEEINRIVTDQLSAYCFTPSADGDENLRREGIPDSRIFQVGNIMIDSLLFSLTRARALPLRAEWGLSPRGYVLATLHRPSNVDHAGQLDEILAAFRSLAERLPVVFPVHPRTRASIEAFGLSVEGLRLVEPVGYLEMVHLLEGAAVVLTDSGGLQEETTVLGVPCVTLRASTERPITVTEGTNRLVPDRQRAAILAAVDAALESSREPRRPHLWDGRTGERIVQVLARAIGH